MIASCGDLQPNFAIPRTGIRLWKKIMKRLFAATVWREGNWWVSQCLEIDIASQGESEREALANLKEALEFHFEPPHSTDCRKFVPLKVEIGAA